MPTAACCRCSQSHCVQCHGGKNPKAKLDLTGPRTLEQLRADTKQLFRVMERVEAGDMPPKDKEPLTAAERQTITGFVRGELSDWMAAIQQTEGRSKFRRLNRNEYANTIQDLFGFRPAIVRDLPSDGRVDGYDKVIAALPLSSVSAGGYVKIAEDILNRMLKPIPKMDRTYRLWAGSSEQSAGHILELEDGTKVSFNTDTTSGPLRFKTEKGQLQPYGTRVPGMHRLRLSVYAYQTDKPLLFGIYAGHTVAYPQLIELVKVLEAPPGKPTVLETDVYLRTQDVNDSAPVSDSFRLIPFGLGVQVPKNTQASKCKGPGLAVQWVDVEEPERPQLGDRWLSADIPPMLQQRLRLGVTTPLKQWPKGTREEFLAAMQATFKRIAPRFCRRDLTEPELTKIVENIARQIDAGVRLDAAFRDEIAALMTAPDFLCIIEQPGKLTDFALASRLSYFLWNSTPDEELLDVARQGRLQDSKVLRQQTERMLKDPKSERFVNDFVDQWLGLRAINDTSPDSKLYPEYDDVLKISSVMETQATFRRILEKNLSVRDFVSPKWALVNERLASHYGLPAVQGFPLQEVPLPSGSPFGGIWTQAATLKVTANGTNTSPVKRGVWVAERLLGIAIPPPPPQASSQSIPTPAGPKRCVSNSNCIAARARVRPVTPSSIPTDSRLRASTSPAASAPTTAKPTPMSPHFPPISAKAAPPGATACPSIAAAQHPKALPSPESSSCGSCSRKTPSNSRAA